MMQRWKTTLAAIAAGSLALLAPAGSGSAAETAEHAVRAGDNLHLIAGYYYRDPRQWRKVWQLNRASIARPNLLLPGKTLRVEVTPGLTWDIPYEEFRARIRGN